MFEEGGILIIFFCLSHLQWDITSIQFLSFKLLASDINSHSLIKSHARFQYEHNFYFIHHDIKISVLFENLYTPPQTNKLSCSSHCHCIEFFSAVLVFISPFCKELHAHNITVSLVKHERYDTHLVKN